MARQKKSTNLDKVSELVNTEIHPNDLAKLSDSGAVNCPDENTLHLILDAVIVVFKLIGGVFKFKGLKFKHSVNPDDEQ